MANMKHVPDLVMVNGVWTLQDFRPTQQAFMYDDHKGHA